MERDTIIDYIFNEGKKTRRIRNKNKRIRYNNKNQENDLRKASATTRIKIGEDGNTTPGGTESIFIAGILNESEDTRTVNNNAHNNDERVQVKDVIDSDSASD